MRKVNFKGLGQSLGNNARNAAAGRAGNSPLVKAQVNFGNARVKMVGPQSKITPQRALEIARAARKALRR